MSSKRHFGSVQNVDLFSCSLGINMNVEFMSPALSGKEKNHLSSVKFPGCTAYTFSSFM